MAQDNQVVIVGNLTRDPELRYTPNGAALVKFGVAVSRRAKDDATGQVKDVDYKDVSLLRKFVSDRGKIRARRVTGNCAQHQRDVATAVKNAREMALLPYTAR